MAALVFLAGVLFGGVAVLLRPWLVDICSGYGQLRPAEELLWSWPENEAAPTLETPRRAPAVPPLVLPRALSLSAEVHVKEASAVAENSSTQKLLWSYNSSTLVKKDGNGSQNPTFGGIRLVHPDESPAEHAHEQGHDHHNESSVKHSLHEQPHGDDLHERPGKHTVHGNDAAALDHQQHVFQKHARNFPGHNHEDFADIQLERGVSLLTLGSVAFFMGLFYLVNHRDEDMRRYAYQIIGETISIFCAVLLFNALYKWVDELTHQVPPSYHVAIFVALFVVFFLGMEVTVMMFARVRGTKAVRRSFLHGKELEIPSHVMNAKTYGAGAAQMCGAASIRSFGRLQLWAYMQANSFSLMLSTVPLAFVSFALLMFFSYLTRLIIIKWDAVVDEAEFNWVQIAEQCEHEVCGLCVGFLLASAARVAVTGFFPHVILADLEHVHHHTHTESNQIALLLLIGLFCVCAGFAWSVVCYGTESKNVHPQKLRTPTASRLALLLVKISGMTFAWCMCFASHLFGQEAEWLNGSQLRLVLSVLQSVASLIFIRVLDFFSDMDCTGPRFENAFVTTIEFFAVTLGLSWEHAFHECVHVTVEYLIEEPHIPTKDAKLCSFFICGLLCTIVLPAYRLYIVPTRHALIEDYEKKAHKAERRFRASVSMGRASSGSKPPSYVERSSFLSVLSSAGPPSDSEGPVESEREHVSNGLEESTYHFRSPSQITTTNRTDDSPPRIST